jgi:hypothetical protein
VRDHRAVGVVAVMRAAEALDQHDSLMRGCRGGGDLLRGEPTDSTVIWTMGLVWMTDIFAWWRAFHRGQAVAGEPDKTWAAWRRGGGAACSRAYGLFRGCAWGRQRCSRWGGAGAAGAGSDLFESWLNGARV